MSKNIITCKNCGAELELSDVLMEQVNLQTKSKSKEIEAQLILQAERFQREKETLVQANHKLLNDALSKKESEILIRIEEQKKVEMLDLQNQVSELTATKKANDSRELELLKIQRQLTEKVEGVELELQKRLAEQSEFIRKTAQEKADEAYTLKLQERDNKIRQLSDSVSQLTQKLQQGSQESQGEALESQVLDILKSAFIQDTFTEFGKGIKGADILQNIFNKSGKRIGSIIWECKYTKTWSNSWIEKLKEDQLHENANISVLVSYTLPKNVQYFDCLDGVYVISVKFAKELAHILREQIISIDREKAMQNGKETKMELVYSYLISQEFKLKIRSIFETFEKMQTQIDRERKVFEKIWKEREMSLNLISNSTAGMMGDLSGLIGDKMDDVLALESLS